MVRLSCEYLLPPSDFLFCNFLLLLFICFLKESYGLTDVIVKEATSLICQKISSYGAPFHSVCWNYCDQLWSQYVAIEGIPIPNLVVTNAHAYVPTVIWPCCYTVLWCNKTTYTATCTHQNRRKLDFIVWRKLNRPNLESSHFNNESTIFNNF